MLLDARLPKPGNCMVFGGGLHGQPLRTGIWSLSTRALASQTHFVKRISQHGLSLATTPIGWAAAASTATVLSNSNAKNKPKAFLRDVGQPFRRGTDVMLGLNFLMFALQKLSRDIITVYGAKVTPAIIAGQYWRLITPGFLHSTLMHLLVNMYSLHAVGPHLEDLGGHRRFLAVYGAASLAGTVCSCVMAPQVISVGSSCAIFGLFGAVGIYYYRHRHLLKSRSKRVFNALGITLLMNCAIAVAVKKLDHWGHLGGLMGGIAAAWLLGPRLVPAEGATAKGPFLDEPPVPVLAFPEPRYAL